MNYFRFMTRVGFLSLSFVVVCGIANAETTNTVKDASKTQAAKVKANPNSLAGQTDVVANKDLPMVTNILPWQEKEGSIPKDMLEFSALKDSLTPTDRDRLAGEIRYTSILNQPTTR